MTYFRSDHFNEGNSAYLELARAADIDVRFHPGFNERRSRLHHHADALRNFKTNPSMNTVRLMGKERPRRP
jgi:hypothetical protein